MEHNTIEENGLIERYHLGTLSRADEELFEAHFMDCAACQQELEVQRSFTRGMKTVAAEDAARSAVRLGLLAWLSRRGSQAALTALVVLAVGSTMLLRENRRLEGRLAELHAGGGDSELARPLSDIPVVLLTVVRGDDSRPLVVTDRGGPWSLAVDVGDDPRITSFAVTIFDADGEVYFERQGLRPNVLEVIQVTFPSGFLVAGEYRLLASGRLPGGESVEIGSYAFRIDP